MAADGAPVDVAHAVVRSQTLGLLLDGNWPEADRPRRGRSASSEPIGHGAALAVRVDVTRNALNRTADILLFHTSFRSRPISTLWMEAVSGKFMERKQWRNVSTSHRPASLSSRCLFSFSSSPSHSRFDSLHSFSFHSC